MAKAKTYYGNNFLKSYKFKNSDSIYLIYGNDVWYKDKITDILIKKFIKPQAMDFDFSQIDCLDTDLGDILDDIDSPPFIAENRVVVLKNFDSLKKNQLNEISKYTDNSTESIKLIIVCKKPDFRKRIFKNLKKNAIVINCTSPYSINNIVHWMRAELRHYKKQASPSAISTFAQLVELDYQIASNELEKLMIFSKDKLEINEKDVLNCVGKTKNNSIFELQNALGRRNRKKTFICLENLFNQNESEIFIVSMILRFFLILWKIKAYRKRNFSFMDIEKVHMKEVFYKFRKDYIDFSKQYSLDEIKNAISELLISDEQLKSISVKGEIIIEIMIHKILGGR